DPTFVHEDTNAKGDNDPIDVIDIGQAIGKQGEIKKVKVLGIMAMLDEGETDWKVIAIDTKDPMASQLNEETHEAWRRLIEGKVPRTTDTYNLEVHNFTVNESPYKMERDAMTVIKEEKYEHVNEEDVKEYDPKWYFV
ncbi:Inorganic pyrophosphatase, partial [Rhizopus stolonifer]